MGVMGLERLGKLSKLSHFSPIFLLFSINFTHFLYISQNVFLAISDNSPFPPISPHFRPFSQAPAARRPTRQRPTQQPAFRGPAIPERQSGKAQCSRGPEHYLPAPHSPHSLPAPPQTPSIALATPTGPRSAAVPMTHDTGV